MASMDAFLLYTVIGLLLVASPAHSLVDDKALAGPDAERASPARRNFVVPHPGACAMDVSAGTADILQAALGIWTSIQVCKKAHVPGSANEMKTMCVADGAGVVASLTNVGQYILGMLASCMGQNHVGAQCAQKSLILAGAISAGASAATSLSNGCVTSKLFHGGTQIYQGATCIVDIRSAMQYFMSAMMSFVHIKEQCDISPENCASFSSHLVASFAAIAKFGLSAAGDCGGKVPPGSECGAEISALIQSMSTIVAASTKVEEACNPNYTAPATMPGAVGVTVQTDGTVILPQGHSLTPQQAATVANLRSQLSQAQRLFGIEKEEPFAPKNAVHSSLSINAVLLGCIPLASLVAFLTGRRAGLGGQSYCGVRSGFGDASDEFVTE